MTFKFPNVSKIMGSRLLTAALLAGPNLALAQSAGGLSRVEDGIDALNSELLGLVAVLGGLAVIIAGIGYMFRFMDWDWFVRIAGGLMIISAGTGFVALFYGG